MTEKTKKKILLIYGIALSALLSVSGILLMAACVSIYKIGSRPFTPENISAAFSGISVPIWITVGAVIVGGILKLVMPIENGKLRARTDKRVTLSRMLSRLGAQDTPSEFLLKIKKEKRLSGILLAIAITLSVTAALPAVIYSLNLNNFGADYNASVISACALMLPCVFLSIGIAIAYVFLENASVERQLGYAREALKSRKAASQLPSRKASLRALRLYSESELHSRQ